MTTQITIRSDRDTDYKFMYKGEEVVLEEIQNQEEAPVEEVTEAVEAPVEAVEAAEEAPAEESAE